MYISRRRNNCNVPAKVPSPVHRYERGNLSPKGGILYTKSSSTSSSQWLRDINQWRIADELEEEAEWDGTSPSLSLPLTRTPLNSVHVRTNYPQSIHKSTMITNQDYTTYD